MRVRSPPPSAGGQEQGDVRLGLMMNSVALQSLSTLASLATTLQALPSGDGSGQSNVDLIRAPFAMLAELLEKFPSQNLVRRYLSIHHVPPLRATVLSSLKCWLSRRLSVARAKWLGWLDLSLRLFSHALYTNVADVWFVCTRWRIRSVQVLEPAAVRTGKEIASGP